MNKIVSEILEKACNDEGFNKIITDILTEMKSNDLIDDGEIENLNIVFRMDGNRTPLKVDSALIKSLQSANEDDLNRGIFDMRMNHILIRNFRRFYGTEYVGLCARFYKDSYPQSLFLIGNNGVGKSSIFSALEYLYLGKISESILREYDKFNIYSNHRGDIKDNDILPLTQDERVEDVKVQIPLAQFFTSEYDFIKMVQLMPKGKDDDWTLFFSNILGLDQIQEMIQSLETLLKALNRKEDFERLIRPDAKEQTKNKLRKKIELIHTAATFFTRQNSQNYNNALAKIKHLKDKFDSWLNDETSKLIEEVKHYLVHEEGENDLKQYLNDLKDENNIYKNAVNLTLNKLDSLKGHISSNVNKRLNEKSPNVNFGTHETSSDEFVKEYLTSINKELGNIIEINKELEQFSLKIKGLNSDEIDWGKYFETIWEQIKIISSEDLEEVTKGLKSKIEVLIKNIKNQRLTWVSNVIGEKFLKELNGFLKEVDFLEKGENIHLKINDDSICFYISKYIDEENNEFSIPVFLNTFRVRYLALCIRFILALRVMEQCNINFPLIYDDIFYASDYYNRNQLGNFFKDVYKYYGERLEEKLGTLQIIFMTHDEQIIPICRRALRDREDVIFGAL